MVSLYIYSQVYIILKERITVGKLALWNIKIYHIKPNNENCYRKRKNSGQSVHSRNSALDGIKFQISGEKVK
jgi:hypothetical protein